MTLNTDTAVQADVIKIPTIAAILARTDGTTEDQQEIVGEQLIQTEADIGPKDETLPS